MVAAGGVLLAGCATTNPGGPDDARRTVTVVGSADASHGVPAPVTPAPATSGEVTCAQGATPAQSLSPSASFDVNDPGQRARRALAEQNRPTATRGVVPAVAIPGAEACVHVLKIQFSLLTAGSRTAPDEQAVEAALRSAGLTKILIHSGPVFAASTGAACVFGSFTATGPAFTIGPLTTDGSCRS
jgi:hypothetical protein